MIFLFFYIYNMFQKQKFATIQKLYFV